MKKLYIAFLFLFMFIPMVHGFAFWPSFNYQTPSGGIVHFNLPFIARTWGVVDTRFTWTNTIYNGLNLGTVGFDPSVNCTMTILTMTDHNMSYNVTAAGARTQIIYYRGFREPDSVTGGTSVSAGDVLTVTTNGNTTVLIAWGSGSVEYNELINNSLVYLGIASLLPAIIAMMYILSLLQGAPFNANQAILVIMSMMFAFIIVAVLYRGFT